MKVLLFYLAKFRNQRVTFCLYNNGWNVVKGTCMYLFRCQLTRMAKCIHLCILHINMCYVYRFWAYHSDWMIYVHGGMNYFWLCQRLIEYRRYEKRAWGFLITFGKAKFFTIVQKEWWKFEIGLSHIWCFVTMMDMMSESL